jgi:hypothetical protein
MPVRVRLIAFIALVALTDPGAAQPPTPKAGQGTTPPSGKLEVGPSFRAGEEQLFRLLAIRQARSIPDDASPLRKTHLAQIREGTEFLSWTQGRLRVGDFTSSDYPAIFEVIDRTYPLLADSEPEAAWKISVLEERVAVLKEYERIARPPGSLPGRTRRTRRISPGSGCAGPRPTCWLSRRNMPITNWPCPPTRRSTNSSRPRSQPPDPGRSFLTPEGPPRPNPRGRKVLFYQWPGKLLTPLQTRLVFQRNSRRYGSCVQ